MIGGEFPIAVSDLYSTENKQASFSDVYAYSSGRAALYQILKYLKTEKHIRHILLPDYLCSSILVPVKTLNLDYTFYPIDELLELEVSSYRNAYSPDSATLLINYFGLKNLSGQIQAIRSIDENAIIIEDDVQAYFEFRKPLNGADFKFTSLRKTFAVPDGGLVKTCHTLPQVSTPNTFGQYKAAASLLKFLRNGNFDDHIYLELYEKGESLIDGNLECGMSNVGRKLYSHINEEEVKKHRLANARYVIEQLEHTGIKPLLPLTDDHVPLFIPIIIKNRDTVRRAMFQQEIFCPVHWPLDGMNVKHGSQLAESELSLIIDQRYERNDMDKIINILTNNI